MADGDVVPMLTEQRVREIVRDELWNAVGDVVSSASDVLAAVVDGAIGSVVDVITGQLLPGDGRKHA
jgi:hypothetical protein